MQNEIYSIESEHEAAQKKIEGMKQQVENCKFFAKDKQNEIQVTTFLKNTLDNGTILLETKVEELNNKKLPMVEKLKKYEDSTTRAYNEMILMLQLKNAAELNIEEKKRKLKNLEKDYNRECKLHKILATLNDLYEKGITKAFSCAGEIEGCSMEQAVATHWKIRNTFKNNLVDTIEGLSKEVPLENLGELRNIKEMQKSLDRNSQLIKKEQMISEKERLNKDINHTEYCLETATISKKETVNTMTGQNILLLSERNLLKQKCGELAGQVRSLEVAIATMMAHIKEKTLDLGSELENRIKEELVENLEKKKSK